MPETVAADDVLGENEPVALSAPEGRPDDTFVFAKLKARNLQTLFPCLSVPLVTRFPRRGFPFPPRAPGEYSTVKKTVREALCG